MYIEFYAARIAFKRVVRLLVKTLRDIDNLNDLKWAPVYALIH